MSEAPTLHIRPPSRTGRARPCRCDGSAAGGAGGGRRGAGRAGADGRSRISTLHASPAEAVSRGAEAAGIRAVPTGLEHGTVTAVTADRPRLEITTLRRDVETDGRHAVVAFTEDWRADAARRDFTINAMSMRRDGAVFDYFGGIEDLRAGMLRFVGDPALRIAEDDLRILRFFRFHARYGRGAPDAGGSGGDPRRRCGAGGAVRRTRVERTQAHPGGARSALAVALMAKLGSAGRRAAEGADPDPLARLIRAGAPADPLLRLAALLTGDSTVCRID